jgi:hypothetical protein
MRLPSGYRDWVRRNGRPALILSTGAEEWRYEAWNEDGRWLGSAHNYFSLADTLKKEGYELVSMNSRCGRTIIDKLNKV